MKILQPFVVLESIIYEGGGHMQEKLPRPCASCEEIIKRHFDMVYKLALSQTRSVTYAEDVTQEVFLRLIRRKPSFENNEHIKAWLIRVTLNCSKSVFMSSWFKKTVPLNEEISFDTPEKSDVYFAVQDLPSKYRTAIHLFYYEDMSIDEISRALGVKQSTVKSHLHRGRELLRERLKGGYDLV